MEQGRLHVRAAGALADPPAQFVRNPPVLLTALAVRLSSPGPVLYRQVRVGLDGALFTVFKFRSMRADAEAGTGAVWASKDDPRVTPVGRLIRRIRFDELAQLFNVLKGEMSIVGPRPERPEFVRALSEQIPYYRQRHCVRPGKGRVRFAVRPGMIRRRPPNFCRSRPAISISPQLSGIAGWNCPSGSWGIRSSDPEIPACRST